MVVIEKLKSFFRINWPTTVNVAGLLLAISYQSRAFIIGFFASICFVWLLKKKVTYSERLKAALILLVTSLALIVFLSYCFKKDSSAGRVLIYKISGLIIKDNWLFGIGYGTFGHEYLNYQADYFKQGHYTIKELLLADNTKHGFNDYLQWIAETGLPGLFMLLAILGYITYLIKRAIAVQINYPNMLVIAISIIIAIATAACFTHVFEQLYFLLLFIWSVFTILNYAYLKFYKQFAVACITVSLIVIYNYDGRRLMQYRKYQKFENAKMLYNAGYIQKALLICQELYPDLNKDVSFLSIYAEILVTSEKSNAILVLKELITLDNSYFFHIRLADYYMKEKDFANSEKEYLKAINMVPNRFTSRYKLFEFYCIAGYKDKAQVTASNIFHLPVKIPSPEIDKIKTYIRDELASRNW